MVTHPSIKFPAIYGTLSCTVYQKFKHAQTAAQCISGWFMAGCLNYTSLLTFTQIFHSPKQLLFFECHSSDFKGEATQPVTPDIVVYWL
jgi:hypothetical protein